MSILLKLSEPLTLSEVDFRIQSITASGYATILAYKDARVDMNRLDSVLNENWQKDYKTIEGRLYCGVGIKVDGEWLWRWDVGTESFSDKEKGQASDAFKRACVNWGIGRELYNYPFICVKLNPDEFTVENNKGKQTYNLQLKNWTWEGDVKNGEVISLNAKDQNGNVRYTFPNKPTYKSNQQKEAPKNTPVLSENDWKVKIESCADLKALESLWFNELPKELQPKLLALKNRIKEQLIAKTHQTA